MRTRVHRSRHRLTATLMAALGALLCISGSGGEHTTATGRIAGVLVGARGADASSDALIHADATRAFGYTGKGVTMALIDTGIDDHNASLASSVVAEHCFVPPDGCPNGAGEQDGPGSAQDDQGHGTAIADIVAGRGGIGPLGIAPDVSLVIVKVADRNGRTSAAQIIAGLDWVRELHPEVRVVNISLAGDVPLSGECTGLGASVQNQAYGATVDALRAQGTTVFAAAGNDGSRNGIPAPACVRGAVAVGAVYSRAFGSFTAPNVCRDTVTAADQVACFSNSSSELDLLAAGAPVDAIGLDSADSPLVGTSAASAQAAGAAAILLQGDPALTPDQVLSVLESTGVPITDVRSRRTTPRIDVALALGAVLGRPVPLLPVPTTGGPIVAPPLSAPTVPTVDVSTKRISFGLVKPKRTVTRKLVIGNIGAGHLTVRILASPPSVSVHPAKLVIESSSRRTVILAFRPPRTGPFRGHLLLQTDDPAAPTLVVALRGTGGP